MAQRCLELIGVPDLEEETDAKPQLVLDIGCGSGLSGEVISSFGHQWIGVDISQSMLQIARDRESEGDLILGDIG